MFSSSLARSFASFLLLSLSTFMFCTAASASGAVDLSFNPSVQQSFFGQVYASAVQPDGKIVIGGRFWAVNGVAAYNVARLNADGSIDPTFNSPGFWANGNQDAIYAVAVQSNGKILVGGRFDGISGTIGSGPSLRRLNTDGSIDVSFPELPFAANSWVYAIEVLPDDSFYVGGQFSYIGLGSFIRLGASGATDLSFTPGVTSTVRAIQVQSDGRVLIGGITTTDSGFINRYFHSGSDDPTFADVTLNERVLAIAQQSDAKILIGGQFTTVNGGPYSRLARLNIDGTLDVPFNQSNTNTTGVVSALKIRGDGKIFVGGAFAVFNGIAKPKLVLLNSTGSVDETFTATLTTAPRVSTLEILGSGKILAGYAFAVNFGESGGLAALNPDGTIDVSRKYDVGRDSGLYKVVLQPDGKIIVGGAFNVANGVARTSLARFNSDGTLDPTFLPAPTLTAASALALQPDGKLLMASSGCCAPSGFIRLNSDGSHDPTFSSPVAGVADIAIMPNGQIVAGTGSVLYKLNPNGSVASNFPSAIPNSMVRQIRILPDGKIYIGGSFSTVGGHPRRGIARLNADETVDQTFVPPNDPNGIVYDFDLQPDGKLVIVGQWNSYNGDPDYRNIARLNPDGTHDPSFAQNSDGTLYAVSVEPNGKIIVGGSMAYVSGGVFMPGLARFTSNGLLDGTFNTTSNAHVLDMVRQPDGKLLIAGAFTRVNGLSRLSVARLLASGGSLFDYDGDGKSDVSVFRPSENKWYVFKSSDSSVLERIFGVAGDVIAPGDFDGDGKSDIAIFRPSSGDWWYLASTDGTQRSVHWGASGDIPRPSDFDGDGKADFIVFRPSENNWYRLGSTGAVSIVNFGLAGDKPVTGDFDGDGNSDPAIYRPSTGDWWYRSSINGAQIANHFGISTDTPTATDFDGDGKTDFAVYRASTGTWYILNSSNGQATIVNFGLAEDKPVAADYDGDGRADIAVYRPSTGIWYLLRSTSGFTALQFGISTDMPTPNAFVP